MSDYHVSRRFFLKTAGAITTLTMMGEIPTDLLAAAAEERRLVKYPEKTDLILLTSRPPQLETPVHYFRELITPNEALFVRWHNANIPTSVDTGQWKLRVSGNTDKEIQLSLDDLKANYEKITYTAVIQCSGNGRSFFEPRVIGGQWKDGAMGNTTWTGVRLKEILNVAGVKPGSTEVTFQGLDKGALPSVPILIKSLPLDKALEDD